MLKKNKRFLLFLLFVSGLSFVALAQPKANSPLSILGLGDFVSPEFAVSAGMGGNLVSYQSAFDFTTANPASYGSLETAAFDLGLYGKYKAMSYKNKAQKIWNGNIKYIALGLPLQNTLNELLEKKRSRLRFGMVFYLAPYTRMDYNIRTEDILPEIDTVVNLFQGTGGTYKVFWGTGMKYKDFSFGVNLGYIFGSLSQVRQDAFQSTVAAVTNSFEDKMSIKGFVWNAGIQYKYYLDKVTEDGKVRSNRRSFTFGATANSISSFTTNSSKKYLALNPLASSTDTVLFENDIKKSGKLPGAFSVGVTYEKSNKLLIGFNYDANKWSKYTNEAKPEQLRDTWKISFGGQYIPDITSYNDYFKKIRYRFGAYYGLDPRGFNTELTFTGITIGAGFPIILTRQRTSFVNIAFELGKLGFEEGYKEKYFKINLGFTLNDNSWFFKRKFN